MATNGISAPEPPIDDPREAPREPDSRPHVRLEDLARGASRGASCVSRGAPDEPAPEGPGADSAAREAAREPLTARLARRTAPGVLYERGPEEGYLRCTACAHRCVLSPGRAGACGIRFEQDGELRVPFGYVARHYVRSVETNTIFHVRPGARALTFGMFGCDLRCPYCQNWKVSQALREPEIDGEPIDISAAALVDLAVAEGCEVIASAYNEPMITAEWARAIFTEARRRGLVTALISDGNTTPEALAYMRPVADVFRVDLKGWSADQYRTLGGRVEPVLASIGEARRLGYWVEVVTLVVPGFNDNPAGLRALGAEIAKVDPDIPWHLNAFYPRYRMRDRMATDPAFLVDIAGVAYARGMKYVYVSNMADRVRELSHTRCPDCLEVVVRRFNYETQEVLLADGACPSCGARVPGLWRQRAA
ncbi:pyruvate formate-lyase activating enzyme [Sorangium cellulosum]|uniref:Pyruvate formate-lyase activating enzyme n=1 Tax=Sorangium cellulosum TaxID=56 RepID=A0A4P2PTR9_SORCE|nr:radical SAM protein [Sorangium cellulosum]AUX19786.1 pyruvate formate-lyase activating enzyme [Sorangium cellulosum]